jgi:antitoxin Phd_YefM of type II toxin-antitoxin system
MKLSVSIKPISYFKAHAAEIIRRISENQESMVITQNGEAKDPGKSCTAENPGTKPEKSE